MLLLDQKNMLLALARSHSTEMRQALALARAHLEPDHMTVRVLMRQVEYAEQTERALEQEPTRQVA